MSSEDQLFIRDKYPILFLCAVQLARQAPGDLLLNTWGWLKQPRIIFLWLVVPGPAIYSGYLPVTTVYHIEVSHPVFLCVVQL